jgi:hypothetical protein
MRVTIRERTSMTDTFCRLAIRARPFLLITLALVVAACQKANGGGGPGY